MARGNFGVAPRSVTFLCPTLSETERAQVATVYELPAGGAAPGGPLTGGKRVPVKEEAYALGPGEQGDFDSDILRLYYSSLSTPPTTIDYNMATGNQCAPEPKHPTCLLKPARSWGFL